VRFQARPARIPVVHQEFGCSVNCRPARRRSGWGGARSLVKAQGSSRKGTRHQCFDVLVFPLKGTRHQCFDVLVFPLELVGRGLGRRPRVLLAGGIHHVYNRVFRGARLPRDEAEADRFEALLAATKSKHWCPAPFRSRRRARAPRIHGQPSTSYRRGSAKMSMAFTRVRMRALCGVWAGMW
jgi:hypothetical protein